jgi:uncharacterized protein with HEPN domain
VPRSDQDRIADILESSARIEWAAMAGMRDIIVHQYFVVDLPLV